MKLLRAMVLVWAILISNQSKADEMTDGIFSWTWDFINWVYPKSANYEPRYWQKYEIDGAYCGNGKPYSIFVSYGDPKKVAFDLMGGGACWSGSTCIGPTPMTILFELNFIWEQGGMISLNDKTSPIADHTVVYVPYCTGDVHIGNHEANYFPFGAVKHVGKRNFELILEQLEAKTAISLPRAEQFVLYGYSAGAIGALIHASTVDKYLSPTAKRLLISDSPGLHFGSDFFSKFPTEWVDDVRTAIARVGARLDTTTGNMAYLVPHLCKKYSNWQVSILQGSRDIVMSRIFGNVSAAEHEKMVFSENGIVNLTRDPTDNCSSWIPYTTAHTFLLFDLTMDIEVQGKTAKDYVFNQIRSGSVGRSFH